MPRITAEHDTTVTAPLEIEAFAHCGRCLDELPSGESARSWARLSVGLTREGIQVWCVRHDCNVTHIRLGLRCDEPEGASHAC